LSDGAHSADVRGRFESQNRSGQIFCICKLIDLALPILFADCENPHANLFKKCWIYRAYSRVSTLLDFGAMRVKEFVAAQKQQASGNNP
jgi:hypothetical protein